MTRFTQFQYALEQADFLYRTEKQIQYIYQKKDDIHYFVVSPHYLDENYLLLETVGLSNGN